MNPCHGSRRSCTTIIACIADRARTDDSRVDVYLYQCLSISLSHSLRLCEMPFKEFMKGELGQRGGHRSRPSPSGDS